MNYEDRIVLFIDILGFRHLIDRTLDERGEDVVERIKDVYDVLSVIKSSFTFDDFGDLKDSTTQVITQFSDSLVISFRKSQRGEVWYTLNLVQIMLINLIFKGIICRGGMSFGRLIHDDNFVYGPALINAYDAESKAALFPRIILDESIIHIGSTYGDNPPDTEREDIKNFVSQDTDNMYYIDYFEKAFANLDYEYDIPLYVDNIRAIIIPFIHTTKPDLKVKYGWMVNKFNIMVNSIRKYEDPEMEAYFREVEYL
ncbi:MAG: hypothetical protein ABSF90_26650 [Syntrophobacteraceae bacterium]